MTRNEVIKEIKTSLKKRSGKSWSVTGGRGTAYGWITIDAPPKRHVDYKMTEEDRQELAKLLGRERINIQGVSIPSSNDHYQEYMDRAKGLEPSVIGKQYWD